VRPGHARRRRRPGASHVSAIACGSRGDPVKERQQLDLLLSRAVDGMIIIGHRIEQRPSMSAGLGVPVIYALTQSLDANEPAVIPDDFGHRHACAVNQTSASNW